MRIRRSLAHAAAGLWLASHSADAHAKRRTRSSLATTASSSSPPSFSIPFRRRRQSLHQFDERDRIQCSAQTARNPRGNIDQNPVSILDKAIHAGAQLQKQIAQLPWKRTLQPILSSSGAYYGLPEETIRKLTTTRQKPKGIRDTMTETLDEVRSMRQEMEALRRELQQMRRQVLGADADKGEETEDQRIVRNVKIRKRQVKYEKLSQEIEAWSSQLLFDTPDSDESWAWIDCHRTFKEKGARTKAYLKWMKDSRGKNANPTDDTEYPCLRMYSTIDAPLEIVCCYLAHPDRMGEYNHLLEETQDLDEISSHSKVCLGETPQILFVKPREFVTFCSHRWLADGTLVIVNQAIDDDEYTSKTKKRPRAYAFRGANYIRKHPDDPEKTSICMLAHGSPGDDVPNWAMRTGVRTLAQMEPFKLFHKINEGVRQARPVLEEELERNEEAEVVSSSSSSSVSARPAGISQLGYACFWTSGGGIQDAASSATPASFDQLASGSPEADPLAPPANAESGNLSEVKTQLQ